MKLSMQMYTVRDAYASDPWGTLRNLRGLGLDYVEIGGTLDLAASEYKRRLDEIGLKVSGNHVSVSRLESDFDGVVQENLALENRFVTVSTVDRSLWEQGWRVVAKKLEGFGRRLAGSGLVLSYHNHAFEFALENGRPGLEVLYDAAAPDFVKAQIDTYWVAFGGKDPAETIRNLAGRVPTVHLKDGKVGGDQPVFLEAGEGDLDWDGILAACAESGVEFGAIEIDVCPRDPQESARACVEFFQARGIC